MLSELVEKLKSWGYKVTPSRVDEPVVGSILVRVDSYSVRAGSFGRLEAVWQFQMLIRERSWEELENKVTELAKQLYDAYGAFFSYEVSFDERTLTASVVLRLITSEVR